MAPMESSLLDFFVGKITDGVGTVVVRELFRERMAQAQEILLKRMAAGRPWLISDHDRAGAFLIYARAAAEGTARRNLDLMAQALCTLASDRAFVPDEYRRHALKLADLTYEEIVLLAAFLRAPPLDEGQADHSHAWNFACGELMGTPCFPSLEELVQWATSLQRFGYVVPWPVNSGLHFTPTPLLAVVGRLVKLDDAMEPEGTHAPV